MNRKILTLLTLAALFLIVGCKRQNHHIQSILDNAQAIINQYPDSALVLLGSIDAAKLDSEAYNHYVLLSVAARSKNRENIENDTLIFGTYRYYARMEDTEHTAKAAYYAGCVRQRRGEMAKAMSALLTAETAVKQTDNIYLTGLIESHIGVLYLYQRLYPQAIKRFPQAVDCFMQIKNYQNVALTLNTLSLCYLGEQKPDSALLYLQQGMQLIKEHPSIKRYVKISLMQNLGLAYYAKNDLEQAKENYANILNSNRDDSLMRIHTYLNIAQLYDKKNQLDSARYYLKHADNCLAIKGDLSAELVYNNLMADVSEKSGDCPSALAYKDKYCDVLKKREEIVEKRNVLDTQRKYDYQHIENEKLELQVQNQRRIITLIFIIFVITYIGIFFYLKSVRVARKLEQMDLKLQQVTAVMESLEHKDNPYKRIVLQHSDILRKLTALNSSLSNSDKQNGEKVLKKFNEVIYGSDVMDWAQVYKSFNELNDNFFDTIHLHYKNLSETEFRLCCLWYAEFDNTEISFVLDLTPGSTRTTKAILKKKLGMDHENNVIEYLNRTLGKR